MLKARVLLEVILEFPGYENEKDLMANVGLEKMNELDDMESYGCIEDEARSTETSIISAEMLES